MRLAIQLAAAAVIGRRGWVRSVIVAVAGLICTMVLLAVLAVPTVLDGESQRYLAQQPRMDHASAAQNSLGYSAASNNYYGTDRVTQVLLGDPSPNPPLPPGISRVPNPGEVFLSPALSALMADNPLLAQWFPQTYAGPITAEGLVSPDQLLAYVGVPPNAFHTEYDDHAVGFGVEAHVTATQVGTRWYQVAGFSMLVVIPALAAFLAAGRVGAAVRRRRSRALSIAGASPAAIATVGGVEAFVPTLAGGCIGAMAFAWAGPMVTRIPITDRAVMSTDVRVHAFVAVLVVFALAIVAGLLSTASAYRAAQLDSTNRPTQTKLRVGMAPVAVFAAGMLLFVACVFRAQARDPLFRPALILTAIGLPAVTIRLTKLVGSAARPDWPVPVLIAFRRLYRDPGAAGTLVAVVAVMTFAVASTIPVVRDHGESTSWESVVTSGRVGDTTVVRGDARSVPLPMEPKVPVPGDIDIVMTLGVWAPDALPDSRRNGEALVATCAEVERLVGKSVEGCSDDAPNRIDRGGSDPAAQRFHLRTVSGEEVEVPGVPHIIVMPGSDGVPIDADVIISPDNPIVAGRTDLFITAMYARVSTTSEAVEEFRAYAIGAGPDVSVDVPGIESVKVNTLNLWILLGILLAASMSLLTALALSITRNMRGSEHALAHLAAPSFVRSASSTLSTATAAFAGATVAIASGLIATVAYDSVSFTRGAEIAVLEPVKYFVLWVIAIVAGVVLGALSEALGRIRTG